MCNCPDPPDPSPSVLKSQWEDKHFIICKTCDFCVCMDSRQYDFGAEWELVNLKLQEEYGSKPRCSGLTDRKYRELFGTGIFGKSKGISHQAVNGKSIRFQKAMRFLEEGKEIPGAFAYICESSCIRSSLCSWTVSEHEIMCKHCESLKSYDGLSKRLRRANQKGKVSAHTNTRYMTNQMLKNNARTEAKKQKILKKKLKRATGTVKKQKVTLHTLQEQLKKSVTLDKDDENNVVHLVWNAYKSGALQDSGALTELLKDTLNGLIKDSQDKSTAKRYSATTKQFYSTLLAQGGQMLHDWVSDIFHGPTAKTTRVHKQNFGYPSDIGFYPKMFDILAELLMRWGLQGVPCLMSEDGSALQTRIDIIERDGKVFVYGLSGGSFAIESVKQLRLAAAERPLGTTIYVYTLVPLARGAPHMPAFAFVHDNSSETFPSNLPARIWEYIWQVSMLLGCKLMT